MHPPVEVALLASQGFESCSRVVGDERCDVVETEVGEEACTDETVGSAVLGIDRSPDVVEQTGQFEDLGPHRIEPYRRCLAQASGVVGDPHGMSESARTAFERFRQPDAPGAHRAALGARGRRSLNAR